IELEICEDEPAALAREASVLRALKPRFNRAGVWPPPPRFLAWRTREATLELALGEQPRENWFVHGPLKGGAIPLRSALVRLLWCGLQPERGMAAMPNGWFHGQLPEAVAIRPAGDGGLSEEACRCLGDLFAGNADGFVQWLQVR